MPNFEKKKQILFNKRIYHIFKPWKSNEIDISTTYHSKHSVMSELIYVVLKRRYCDALRTKAKT